MTSPQRTLDELAAQQRVRPVRSLAELTLSEPLTDEEYADFLAAAMSARGTPDGGSAVSPRRAHGTRPRPAPRTARHSGSRGTARNR